METSWITDGARILQAIGWTLIHTLWQGALVYALLSLLLRSMPGLPARIRYGCGCLALAAIVVWGLHTLGRHWPLPHPAGTGATLAAAGTGAAPGILRLLDAAIPWLMTGYGLGLGTMLGRLLLGFNELRGLKRGGTALGGALHARLLTLAGGMSLRRQVRLRHSPTVAVPMVIGFLRPVILLPATCLESLSPAALDAILLHELAHIRRADYLVNILQCVIEAILFFNPAVRCIGALLRREREHCCDDLVIGQSVNRLEYAAALASLAAGPAPAFALPARDGRYPLLHRIKRITTMETKSLRPGAVFAVSGMAALAIAVAVICFTPAFAQRRQQPAKASTQTARPAPPAPARSADDPSDALAPVPPAPPAAPLLPAVPAPPAALSDLQETLPGLGDSIGAAVGAALNTVDWTELRRELQQASAGIGAIDWKAIESETRRALAQASREIDWNAISKATAEAMKAAELALAAAAPAPEDRTEPRRLSRHERMQWMDQLTDEQIQDARRAAADLRRKAADARRQREHLAGQRQAQAEQQRAAREKLKEARQEMEDARMELEEARREMERARRELERARR